MICFANAGVADFPVGEVTEEHGDKTIYIACQGNTVSGKRAYHSE